MTTLQLTPHQRRVLVRLIVLGVVAIALLQGLLHAPRAWTAGPLPLELADSARSFRTALLADWMQPAEPAGSVPRCGLGMPHLADMATLGTELPGFGRLRCNLFFDSLLLVPAYVALLVFLTLALGPPVARHPWGRQLLCVPAVAAGLFDVAENSMTGRALDDLLLFALHDQTVADVTLASRIKWMLLALALALLAWRCWVARQADAPWLSAVAAIGLAGAVALAAGGWAAAAGPLTPGMAALVAVFALLSWRLLRTPPAIATATATG